MFELGIRLAFDKATIIIKDDKTSYSFDTAPIEHLTYPRDLRFNKIIDFKKELSEKVKATYSKSINDPNFTTFLKHFGKFTVAKVESKEVSKEEYILEEIKEIRKILSVSKTIERNATIQLKEKAASYWYQIKLSGKDEQINIAFEFLKKMNYVIFNKDPYLNGGIVAIIWGRDIWNNFKHKEIETKSGCKIFIQSA